MIRTLAALLVVAMLGLAPGCAMAPLVDPTLFPRTALPVPAPAAARVALVVDEAVAATLTRRKLYGDSTVEEYPAIGRIVERAGIEVLQAVPSSDATLTVVVDGVSCLVDRRLKWFVPVPYIGPSDYSIEVRVTMALRVLDARGRVLLVRTYDSGPQVVASELRAPPNAVWRMAHETVWRLWQQADGDLRHAWQVDRTRDRDL